MKVFNKHGAFVREYTGDLHGENYKELAAGFAKKIGGSVNEPRDANSLLAKEFAKDPELKAKADEILKPKFCDTCDSKGVKHKKECPKVAKNDETNAA